MAEETSIMNITEAKTIIERQMILNRTAAKGWPLSDFAKESLNACLQDINAQKNTEAPAMRCLNCGLIISQLLIEAEGCPNCSGLDIDDNIDPNEFI